MTIKAVLFCSTAALVSACHQAPAAGRAASVAPSVFSDSLLHAAVCEFPRPGQSWRTSCQPKDQRAEIVRLAPAPQ